MTSKTNYYLCDECHESILGRGYNHLCIHCHANKLANESFDKLLREQEPLGDEFENILNDNKGELYGS